MTLLDIENAFLSVDHAALWVKLTELGARNPHPRLATLTLLYTAITEAWEMSQDGNAVCDLQFSLPSSATPRWMCSRSQYWTTWRDQLNQTGIRIKNSWEVIYT